MTENERDPRAEGAPEAPKKSLGERILECAPQAHLRFTQCLYCIELQFLAFEKDYSRGLNINEFVEVIRNLCTDRASYSPFQKIHEIVSVLHATGQFSHDEIPLIAILLAHKTRGRFVDRLEAAQTKGPEAFKQCATNSLVEIQGLKDRTATREGFVAYLNG